MSIALFVLGALGFRVDFRPQGGVVEDRESGARRRYRDNAELAIFDSLHPCAGDVVVGEVVALASQKGVDRLDGEALVCECPCEVYLCLARAREKHERPVRRIQPKPRVESEVVRWRRAGVAWRWRWFVADICG